MTKLIFLLLLCMGLFIGVSAQPGFADPKFKEIGLYMPSSNYLKLDTAKRINAQTLFGTFRT